MTMENCNLFRRSFTNKGLGFTFNSDLIKNLYKESANNKVFFKAMMMNRNDPISNMKNAGSKHALNILVENSIEEVENYEKQIDPISKKGKSKLKPINLAVTLHNPTEPANIRSNSFKIPLGYSTNVYISLFSLNITVALGVTYIFLYKNKVS